MGYNAGKFDAIIIDHGFNTTSTGKLQVAVTFRYADSEGEKELSWFGSFNEGKAREITLEGLKRMGLKSKADFPQLAMGVDSGVLNYSEQIPITVAMEEYEGKVSPKIKGIGGGGIASKLGLAESVTMLQGLNIQGDLAKMFGTAPASKMAPSNGIDFSKRTSQPVSTPPPAIPQSDVGAFDIPW